MKNIEVKVPAWARGPFELICHADQHFRLDGDIDRRIALIGFDNAIEVCIDTFTTLHPKLRNGLELSRDETEKARRSYHSKVEFLDKYIKENHLALPTKDILWYHQLRNELYHSGNGLVPERHVIEGSRAAALVVFKVLFDVDVSLLLDEKRVGNKLAIAAKPRKEAEIIRDCSQQNGPVMVWQDQKNKKRFVQVVALPDGRYGIQVLERIGGRVEELTSYVPKENTLQEIEKRLSKGFALYTEPLSS